MVVRAAAACGDSGRRATKELDESVPNADIDDASRRSVFTAVFGAGADGIGGKGAATAAPFDDVDDDGAMSCTTEATVVAPERRPVDVC